MSATTTKKPAAKTFLLPVGRLLVAHVFERDIYKDADTGAEGKPKYKVVMAFDPRDVEGEGTIEDDMADAMAAAYGDAVADEWLDKKRADRIRPMKDGDVLAKEREAHGKDGDAMKGKLIISADTVWNKDGVEGPGGISVYGPDTSPITFADQGAIYSGCFGIAAVTLSPYKDYPRKGDRGIKCYLKAFQKTEDGAKLTTAADNSTLFKPVGGVAGVATAGVRRRRPG